MKYCTECGAEYQDSATKCSDCARSELVSAEEMRRRGIPLASDRDTRKFAPAGTAEDPLTQEALVHLLEEQDIPVFARPRQGGPVAPITSPASQWWEILVPEDQVQKASRLIEEEKARMKATEDDAARAAEEEAAESAGRKP
jgi:hypothetical protein